MRRNLYILPQCTFLLFIILLVNGCSLHEEPEMTPEGELGVSRYGSSVVGSRDKLRLQTPSFQTLGSGI